MLYYYTELHVKESKGIKRNSIILFNSDLKIDNKTVFYPW